MACWALAAVGVTFLNSVYVVVLKCIIHKFFSHAIIIIPALENGTTKCREKTCKTNATEAEAMDSSSHTSHHPGRLLCSVLYKPCFQPIGPTNGGIAPTSPLLFSNSPSELDTNFATLHPPTNISPIPNLDISQLQNINDSDCHVASNVVIGDVDTDLIEMDLYDTYRKKDGEQYSTEYLHKCRDKLRIKVQQDRVKLIELQRKNMELKLESKREKERIRKYYETIAFGRSRTGKIVRSAMGTSSAAGKRKIVKELKTLYSVGHDSLYQ